MAERIKAKGKFFFDHNDNKFFLKGVTYGTFRPDEDGFQYPAREVVAKDLRLMQEVGVNCIRVYTPPPLWLLDDLHQAGIRLLLGIAWPQHINFLDSSAQRREIRSRVAETVRDLRGHPAIMGYMIGNEIPADIVRWYGQEKIQRFLNLLYDVAKQQDPDGLISYANFPTTEYLELSFLDFVSFNVYLHRDSDYRGYIMRLHSLAEVKPLVLSEFGADSIREGEEVQARILSNKLLAGAELGVAGNIVFSWTDEWYRGGHEITDWDFGLVTRERLPKPAFMAVAERFKLAMPPTPENPPLVSVVVCAYNAERTIDSCLASLEHLNYPNYEVIVVNDGSTDRTQIICNSYPYIRLINQENKGLSEARNVGMLASRGDIVAYTDSDCDADPDWLNYLVTTFKLTGLKAVGGPNFPPPENDLVPSVVAVSPGGPTHVLLTDDTAEHIAGCNMAFDREVLIGIGGFDVQFRAAGDDIDICWRLQDLGYTIGFSPSAVVWHFRRNTVKDYLNQQRGYGKAEAMVYCKHPDRFNLLGQARWLGRIYGDLSMSLMPTKPIIYSGTFGKGLFQTLYTSPAPVWSYLPFTLEWNLLSVVFLLALSLVNVNPLWALPPFLITFCSCIIGASQAKIDPRFRNLRGFLLSAYLLFMGPLVRGIERYKWRLKLSGKPERLPDSPQLSAKMLSLRSRSMNFAYWSEGGVDREVLLAALVPLLQSRKFFVIIDAGWNPWDLVIAQGLWAKVKLISATEDHGGNKRLTRIRITSARTFFQKVTAVTWISGAIFFLAFKLPIVSYIFIVLGLIVYLFVWQQKAQLMYRISWCIQSIGSQLDLSDLNQQKS
jgi:glycosyltransferase involved in cell wall biosynthesis